MSYLERQGDAQAFCPLEGPFIVMEVRTMCGSRIGGWSLPCVMSD
jgi:hypothetical protein